MFLSNPFTNRQPYRETDRQAVNIRRISNLLCDVRDVRCTTPANKNASSERSVTHNNYQITNRSFRYASPDLWNQLPVSFRQPCTKHPADDVTLSNSPPTCSPLSPSITYSLFHSRLKTHLFHKSFPP